MKQSGLEPSTIAATPNAGWARHIAAILLLPVVATLVVPWLLTRDAVARPDALASNGMAAVVARAVGVVLLLAGLALFGWCVRLFARVGGGTLAPWDPAPRLVVTGPYRYVRNPMISAVAAILIAEALLFASQRLALWAVAFIIVNHVYFVVSEEPGLRRRFGARYERYRNVVPRWVPGHQPWVDEEDVE